MRGHWLSTFALIGIGVFAGGALFAKALRTLDTAWIAVAAAFGAIAALCVRYFRTRRQRH